MLGKSIAGMVIAGILSIPKVSASPWIGTTDPQLHYDVQILAEMGYLKVSASTFPLPWKDIADQLQPLQAADMPVIAATATRRLQHYANLLRQQATHTSLTLYGATDQSRFASFDGQQGEKARVNGTLETRSGDFAAKVSANFQTGGETNFDQSFIAYQFGDWNLRAGAIDQWWGPGHANSLVLSNNARPIPALAFSRSRSSASEDSWLSFLGPWYATAQVGQLLDQYNVADSKIWASRFTAMPIKGLELGLSWLATWGGENQDDDLRDFFDVITLQQRCTDGTKNCEPSLRNNVGNHIVGLDFKYTINLADRPVNLYGQYIHEGESTAFNASNHASQWGVSSYLWNAKVYLEYSDTNVSCTDSVDDIRQCFYESGTYSPGYRFYNRALGDTSDSEAKMWSMGYLRHFSDGDVLELAVRKINLKQVSQQDTSNIPGLTEEIIQLSGYYQTVWGNWQVKLGAVLDSSDINLRGTDQDLLGFAEVKYSF